MTGIDYPPTQRTVFAAALDRLDEEADQAGEEDPVDETHRHALMWAVDQWGDDAEVTLEAFTTAARSRTLDTLHRTRVGPVGNQQITDWLIAAAITDAPWLDGGEDLETQADLVGQLPPALRDWLDEQLDELNDLTAGN